MGSESEEASDEELRRSVFGNSEDAESRSSHSGYAGRHSKKRKTRGAKAKE
jgi:hypothetical protein